MLLLVIFWNFNSRRFSYSKIFWLFLVSGSYLPFALSGTQDQRWKSWSRKYYTKIIVNNTTMLQYCVYWIILILSHSRHIWCRYICLHKVSYIHYFFVIFNCNTFSALHAKHFEIWKNILWNRWVDCFIAQSIKWYDFSGCS